MPNTWEPPKEHLLATNISQPRLHTLPKPRYWHVVTLALHLHPPTYKRPLHSPTQQSSTSNSPHTLIQQTHKMLYPTKCWQPTRLAQRYHNPRMVNTMHMPPQHMHMSSPTKTWHIMSTRDLIDSHTSFPPNPSNTIQFIKFTYWDDRFPNTAMRPKKKENAYNPHGARHSTFGLTLLF